MSTLNFSDKLILVRGAGDLASGTIHRLVRCGFPVLVLEIPMPSAIRRQVAFSEAVYDGTAQIEGVICQRVPSLEQAQTELAAGHAALMVDPDCSILEKIRPWAVVDAILAKKNMGTCRAMADKTIALGPGFTAGEDVDLVIETKRGHNLGRILTEGCAAPNTGIPGIVGGWGKERVIHAPADGRLEALSSIGDLVQQGQVIALLHPDNGQEATPVYASLTGLLRGMIRDGYPVWKGLKIADIDPRREEYENCFTISDKARCLAGSVLAGLLSLEAKKNR